MLSVGRTSSGWGWAASSASSLAFAGPGSQLRRGPPSGLPADIDKDWEETLEKVFKDPEWVAQMNKAGYPPSALLGEKLSSGVKATLDSTEKFKDVIAGLGIK
jgi:3-oxoacyl-ACP reductase-like protein